MPDSDVRRLFYRNGQLRQEEPVTAGLLHGAVRVWHKNGILASESPHVRGDLHGTCRQWDEQGRLLGSYEMIHGTGIQRQWHDNGRLKLEISTVDGKFCGRSRSWLRDGTLARSEYFLNNESVTREEYYVAAMSDPRFPNHEDAVPEAVTHDGPALKRLEHELFVQALLDRPNHADALAGLYKLIRGLCAIGA